MDKMIKGSAEELSKRLNKALEEHREKMRERDARMEAIPTLDNGKEYSPRMFGHNGDKDQPKSDARSQTASQGRES
ncbi:MAG: hypothetical protein LHW45_08000 [Candidatus Cloacimonetes bacterium]|nr:hypothetical protein [Candidatus Cloacimonadota bacterium]MDY0367551.1 hypothetical protein [Candidatus Syntrophosphaera sp.]